MAKPQLEDGYTRIANELLDALCKVDLTRNECKVLFSVIRKTYGWHKLQDNLSVSQICLMTGLRHERVVDALRGLKNKNIITRERYCMTSLQKDYMKWGVEGETGRTKIRPGEDENPSQKRTEIRPKKDGNSSSQKIKDNKYIHAKSEILNEGETMNPVKGKDFLELAAESLAYKESYSIPKEAGGADTLGSALLKEFCHCMGVNQDAMPAKKAIQWRNELSNVAEEWRATEEQALTALRATLDEKGEFGFKSYSSPFQKSFRADFEIMLGRAVSGNKTSKPKGDKPKDIKWLEN